MCGRFSLTKVDDKTIVKRFSLKVPPKLKPGYNFAPSMNIAAILNDSKEQVTMVKWGLIPSWGKNDKLGIKLFNARSETIDQKPVFKSSFRSKRCLILADSFYEWKKVNGKKIPFRIMLKNESLFAFAGIWDKSFINGKEIQSCAIITTIPNALVKDIHDRMPVILKPEEEGPWLKEKDPDKALEMLKPYDPYQQKCYEIGTLVNSPGNDFEEIIKPKI
ncbi:MAG: SOS response-associated peptidase [Candidatus Omnitrophica bacterium]|nr:SOS response-associated peptidase [Candidatus Omnitrophota bacterium]